LQAVKCTTFCMLAKVSQAEKRLSCEYSGIDVRAVRWLENRLAIIRNVVFHHAGITGSMVRIFTYEIVKKITMWYNKHI